MIVNFTRGDVADAAFCSALEVALAGKSRVSVVQSLKSDGVPREMADKYADEIMAVALKERRKAMRPHVAVGWTGIISGILVLLYMWEQGYIAGLGVTLICWGIYWILAHRVR